jgi:hypothetical protein
LLQQNGGADIEDPEEKEYFDEKIKECMFNSAVIQYKGQLNHFKKHVFKRIKK